MKKISEEALFERAKRFERKHSFRKLRKHDHREPDHLMNGTLYAFSVDPNTNRVDWYTDWAGFLKWVKEEKILMPYEEVVVDE